MKDVIKTTTFRREKSNVVIYEVKIKNIFSNIKNKKVKVIEKTDNIIHLKLQIKKIK